MYSILLGFMYLYIVKKVELEIINITQGFTQHHSYAVVLGEVKGKRRLPIVIGTAEAQSIASAIENMTPARPPAHARPHEKCDGYLSCISERNRDLQPDGRRLLLQTDLYFQRGRT